MGVNIYIYIYIYYNFIVILFSNELILGSDCSQMISDEIPTKVTANLRNYAPPEEALYSAFMDTDTEFIK